MFIYSIKVHLSLHTLYIIYVTGHRTVKMNCKIKPLKKTGTV